MDIQGRYQDEDDLADPPTDGHPDAPPLYESISAVHGKCSIDEKLTQQRGSNTQYGSRVGSTYLPVSRLPQSNPRSRSSTSSCPSLRTSAQVRQTVRTLVRDLVLNVESPNLLDSCANACRTYRLDLSALLQEPFIENRSAICWAILKNRDALLPSLLVHAAPLSPSTLSEIRLACLVTANQCLFQSLRCRRESLIKEMTPLSMCNGTDALVLGSVPEDEVSVREIEGQGAFVAEMRINLFQKRLRVSSSVGLEFIARGRIWYLSFFSPPSTKVLGLWRVVLRLSEHSPPTFVNSRLVINLPPPLPNTSTGDDLISLSPPSDDLSDPARSLPLPPPSLTSLQELKPRLESKALQSIEVRLNSTHCLAYRDSNTVEQWMDDDKSYTNAVLVPLDDGPSAELFYDNTPFIANDGTLYARLEAKLEKPSATGCVLC